MPANCHAPRAEQLPPIRVTLGGQGSRQWLLDGRLQGDSEGAAALPLALRQPGRYTVTALARNGAFSSLPLNAVDWPAAPVARHGRRRRKPPAADNRIGGGELWLTGVV